VNEGIETLVLRWRDHSTLLRQYRNLQQAEWLEDRAAELETALRAQRDAPVTLQQAATISGYGTDHLRRLHREGKLIATRAGRRLLFRTGDLPKKPTTVVDGPPRRAYDPTAHARQVAIRRSRGGSIHDAQEVA
jgi:hypothetical protein